MGKLTHAESAERLRALLASITKEMVDRPDGVHVTTSLSDGGGTVVLTVRTADGEVGKVIGKQGRNAQALRVLLEAVAAKYRQRVVLEIDDKPPKRKRVEHDDKDLG